MATISARIPENSFFQKCYGVIPFVGEMLVGCQLHALRGRLRQASPPEQLEIQKVALDYITAKLVGSCLTIAVLVASFLLGR